ncbi:MAG: ribosome biogenesis GTPase Der [Phycisphaerae bacterium]|nr:ribosome biogenesis GTPase Der [Phycisphaerae bacterium]
MALSVVAIVGRPNVGKSSLLNALARQRISIVEETAGVTRDRISTIIEKDDQFFELVDTGGIGIVDHDNLTYHVEDQINLALDQADLVVFVVDIREGITVLDRQVADMLRKKKLKVLLVANKADSYEWNNMAGEFCKLGFDEPICVSAEHGRNCEELVEYILYNLKGLDTTRPEDTEMKVAVVGKRNAGKSTFINSLAGEERVIVSEVAGTTRDAVDVRIERDGKTMLVIDTAGVRKKSKITDGSNSIEYYSYIRATQSIQRADVVMLFIDATLPISQVDKKLASFIATNYKPCIIVINKWDLVKENSLTDDYADYIDKIMPGLAYAPISFVTAKDGKNVHSLMDLSRQLYKQAKTKIPTAKINKAIRSITEGRVPSARRKVGGLPKFYYGTQVATSPPTILMFVNKVEFIDENYRRFLVNRLRDILPFSEIPIRILVRSRGDSESEPKEV